MGYPFHGVDISWPQGNNYRPPAGNAFVGVGAVSLDGGTPFVQSTYHAQVDMAHSLGLPVVHYAFNGRTDRVSASAFADFFLDNLYGVGPDDVFALDVESSEGDTYPAWTAPTAQQFSNRFAQRRGITTQKSRLGIYGNRTDMGQPGWGAVEASGSWLWLAWPGAESSITHGEWSDWTMWQYAQTDVDQNWSKLSLPQIAGNSLPTPVLEDDMIIYTALSADGQDNLVAAGDWYIQEGAGHLRHLWAAEAGAYIYWAKTAASPVSGSPAVTIPFRSAQWSGDSIRNLIKLVGCYEWDINGATTGRIIYGDRQNPVTPGAPTLTEAQIVEIIAGLKGAFPTAAENGAAARAAIVANS